MKKIAGIDGSKGGWVCVSGYENNFKELKFEKLKEFNDIKSKDFDLVLVDIPIGLDINLKKGGRIVDKLARKELLTNKSSIFNAPSRLVLEATNYEEANKINKNKGMGLSKQSWNLVKKIKEVDDFIRNSNKTIIFESHPEIIFQVMKRDKVSTKKKNDEGIIERRNLLEKNGFNKVFLERNLSAKDSFYKKDDFIDACSLFWSANRAIAKTEVKIPNDIVLDSEGIIMQIKV
jgi:predicted RNase H-like nuclease|tara:strand:- start:195 stop:893 length:699 start_codon:yes stop_codon:yes gene_type:complete